VEVTVWFQDVVSPSSFVLDDLVKQLDTSDFGIFIFAPDDSVTIRGATQATVRDNAAL
jgi:predicted nucleotide-binding protein